MPKPTELNHSAIVVENFEKSFEFYERVLGFERLPRPPFGIDGAWYKCGANQVHVIENNNGNHELDYPNGNNPTERHMALAVENLAEVQAALDEMGMVYDKVDMTVGDTTIHAIYVKDPDGNTFEVRESYPMPKG